MDLVILLQIDAIEQNITLDVVLRIRLRRTHQVGNHFKGI